MVQRVKDLARSAVAQVTAMARVQSLARELPHATTMTIKPPKTKNKQEQTDKPLHAFMSNV